MDEKPKSSARRVQLMWLIFILIQLAAIVLIKWLFDTSILLYLVGLNLLIALLRIKKEPISKARWGFKLGLTFIAGALPIVLLVFCWHWLHFGEKQEVGLIGPNPTYAQMVAQKLIFNVMSGMNTPNEVYIWRNTGRLEGPLVFQKPAVFWFSYNMAADSFSFYRPDTGISPMPAPAGWKQKFSPLIPALLQEKKEWGWVDKVIQSEGREFRIRGKIYPDEPRVIAVVSDMEVFFKEAAKVFQKANANLPLLDNFTAIPQPGIKNGQPSSMTISFRDSRDSIIAQLGTLGNYKPGKHPKKYEYSKSYPFKNIGATMEIVIPRCVEKEFNTIIMNMFILLVITWLGTLLLWAKAEVHLSMTKKKLAEREINTPIV